MDTEKLLIAERAAEWMIRLETATAKERAEFWQWLCQSPLHVGEVLAAKACHLQLTELLRKGCIDIDALMRADNMRDLETRGNSDTRGSSNELDEPAVPRGSSR